MIYKSIVYLTDSDGRMKRRGVIAMFAKTRMLQSYMLSAQIRDVPNATVTAIYGEPTPRILTWLVTSRQSPLCISILILIWFLDLVIHELEMSFLLETVYMRRLS